MRDLHQHLLRQMAFSRSTFGPGNRSAGVSEHIRQELDEIASCYEGKPIQPDLAATKEWTDVILLALDGAWRSVRAAYPDATQEQVARIVVDGIIEKQGINELRDWPDWRDVPQDQAINHDRSKD